MVMNTKRDISGDLRTGMTSADGAGRPVLIRVDGAASDQATVRLYENGLLRPTRTPVFDRVVEQARRIFSCTTSLLTIIDEDNDRQFFKAEAGLMLAADEARETSLAYSFCRIVVANSAPLVIADARSDPRVRGHEAIGKFGVIAYLGVPVKDETGKAIAALCVAETRPRAWTSANVEVLQSFAEGVSTQIKSMVLSERMRIDAGRPQGGGDATARKYPSASLTYYHGPDGTEKIDAATAETQRIWGISAAEYMEAFGDVFGFCLVEDYPLARASFGNSAGGMIPWHHRWRIRLPHGQVKWLEGHGLPVSSPGGAIIWKCAISDVTPGYS